jgi:hypothetical protein
MNPSQRIIALLEHVKTGDRNRFNDFCRALWKSDQAHIVNDYLLKSGSCQDDGDGVAGDSTDSTEPVPLMSPADKSMLEANWNQILTICNCDMVLLNELEKQKVFMSSVIRGLKEKSNTDRTEWILKELYYSGTADQFVKFCKALRRCEQSHVVSLMRSPVQQLPSSASCPTPPTAAESLDEQTTPNLPLPVPSESSSASEQLSLGNLLQVNNTSADDPVRPAVILDHLPSSSVPSVTSTQFTFPPSNVVERMKMEVREERAYSVAYCPDCPSVTRGQALIIANSNFTAPQLAERHGTKADILNLTKLFDFLKLDTKVLTDLTAQEIRQMCENESKLDVRSSVFVLCILSHGRKDVILGTDGEELALDDIMTIFDGRNCAHLLNKPKLFLVQACQGDAKTEGVKSDESDAANNDVEKLLEDLSILEPRHEKADMAIVLATYPGYVAYRNLAKGSYFVQQLAEVFQQQAYEHHFADMILEVTRRMNKLQMAGHQKQICWTKMGLDKHVYLLPY